MSTLKVNEVWHTNNASITGNIVLNSNGNTSLQGVSASGTITAASVSSTGNISGSQLISSVADGTAPLTVASTTVVQNLNADNVDGKTYGASDGNMPVLGAPASANSAPAAGTLSTEFLAKAVPAGDFVGTSDTQSLSNKTFTTSTEIQGLLTVTGGSAEIRCDGDVTAYYTSDIRKKRNVRMISSNPLADLAVLRGVRFEWLEDHPTAGESSVGVIAQEVQPVVPEAVIQRPDGTLAVRYELLIPLLIESINQLSKQVQELQRAME